MYPTPPYPPPPPPTRSLPYPKQLISRVPWRVYDVLYIMEFPRLILAMALLREEENVRPDDPFYTLLAFPMEEGIGGRSMYQWNSAYRVGYYMNENAAVGYISWAASFVEKMMINGEPISEMTEMDPRW